MMNQLITVVIPTYNRASCLPTAIESVLSQDYQNFELVIIDDGSTDDTAEVLRRYVDKVPSDKIVYYRQANKGCACARNAGIKLAKGNYICFLDSDDYYSPNSLSLRVAASQIYDADFVIGRSGLIRRIGQKKATVRGLPIEQATFVERSTGRVFLCDSNKFLSCLVEKGPGVDINSIMLKREFLGRMGDFDENLIYSEDMDFYYRVFLFSQRFIYVDEILSFYNYCHMYQAGGGTYEQIFAGIFEKKPDDTLHL